MSAEIYRWSVAVHVISAIVWVGGMWFVGLVLAPEIRRLENPAFLTTLYHSLGPRFRVIGWLAIALLILSGLYNLAYRGFDVARIFSPLFLSSRVGVLLVSKLSLVVVIIALSALHDFSYGPKLRSLQAGSDDWARLRKKISWIGRANAVLAMIVVVLGTRLFR